MRPRGGFAPPIQNRLTASPLKITQPPQPNQAAASASARVRKKSCELVFANWLGLAFTAPTPKPLAIKMGLGVVAPYSWWRDRLASGFAGSPPAPNGWLVLFRSAGVPPATTPLREFPSPRLLCEGRYLFRQVNDAQRSLGRQLRAFDDAPQPLPSRPSIRIRPIGLRRGDRVLGVSTAAP
jgi:hypothetical protein